MTRKNIALPTLQVAATAFLAGTANAAPYCVEKSTSKVVAAHACPLDRDTADFSTVEGPPGAEVDSVVRRSEDLSDDEREAQELRAEAEKTLKVLKLVAGGFGGTGARCERDRVCSLFGGTAGPGFGGGGHWGGGGFVAIGGGGGGSGGRVRGSGSRGG